DAANRYSQDEGNVATPNGGDLGFFPRKQFTESVAAAAFGLKVGQISDPVETEYGYHLFQVTDRHEGRPVELSQIKERVLAEFANPPQSPISPNARKPPKAAANPMPPPLSPKPPAAPAATAPAPKAAPR